MDVTVINENTVEVNIGAQAPVVVEVDQGKAGRGIVSVTYEPDGSVYYLEITYTDGTTELVGPIPVDEPATLINYYIKASAAITKGDLVMFTGAVGNSGVLEGAPASASLSEGLLVMGIASETIAHNGFGYVTSFGLVSAVDTTGSAVGETWADGDILYYNPNYVGKLTKVRPTSPAEVVVVAAVIKSNAGNGSLFIRVSFYPKLSELSDVYAPSPANNNLISWNSSNNRWQDTNAISVATLTTSGAVTLNGGTADGVAYLNGSKVLTTGSVLTFDGTNLGVGTNSPAQRLHVYGGGAQALIESPSAVASIAWKSVTGSADSNRWHLRMSDSTGSLTLQALNDAGGGGSSTVKFERSGNNISSVNVSLNSTSDALRITQIGTGNALVVEDSANPDATPFVVNANGNVIVGATSSLSGYGYTPSVQSHGSTVSASSLLLQCTASAAAYPILTMGNASSSNNGVVAINQILGQIRFYGGDGAIPLRSAQISAEVDGTPGTNDMPGRLVFSTTADGASTPTERIRIDSSGTVFMRDGTSTTNTNSSKLVVDGSISETVSGTQYLVASQFDIGTAPNEIPLNGYLGALAYQDTAPVPVPLIINASTSTDAVRITQTGTGNALVVEDSANPDSTPFMVDASGNVGVGLTPTVKFDVSGGVAQFTGGDLIAYRPQTGGTGGQLQVTFNTEDTAGPSLFFNKSRGTSTSRVIVNSGDALATLLFRGYDGAGNIQAALISAVVDGTPGTNDMPGRLVFSTTADGASSPTERMRIDSAGAVKVTGDTLIVATAKTPASATATGVTGQIAWDANYVYVCVATNTWKRSALSTW